MLLTKMYSTNDALAFEIEAADTQFQATTASKAAFEALVDANMWMIFRNIETGVLHWDFVSIISYFMMGLMSCLPVIHCQSVLGRFISFPVADNQLRRFGISRSLSN